MKKPILYFDMDGVLVDFHSALMKNYLSFVLFVLSFLSCLSFTSCKGADGAQEEPLTANKLLMAIARETGDSAVKDFSAEMLDTIEMYMDSALVVVKDKVQIKRIQQPWKCQSPNMMNTMEYGKL